MLKYGLLFLLGASAHGASFDPPDLNLEAHLHQQFLQGSGDNPTHPTTQGLVENYQLQKGENLWSLSQMLYGDGNYWPRVWAQNKSITNPHLIRQGHTLQLLLGSEDDAPAFRFSENEDAGLELTAASASSVNPQIEIPEPEIAPRPVLRIPHSFPEYQRAFATPKDNFGGNIDDRGLQLERAKIAGRFPLTAFVQDGVLNSQGRFIEPERETALPVAMQYVYVKVQKGKGAIGKKFLIVKDMGRLPKVNDQVNGNISARFVQVFGDVQLTELATPSFRNSSDAKMFDIYRGLILHAINVTQMDFDLIPGEVQIVDMTGDGPSATVAAQVIGSAKAQSSLLYGIGDIVFINKGAKDGVEPGQIMDLFIDRTIRDPRTPVRYAGNPSGKYKVARVSEHCATGIILSAIDSIQQGDRAAGKQLAKNSPAPAEVAPPSDELDEYPATNSGTDQAAPPPADDNGDLPAE